MVEHECDLHEWKCLPFSQEKPLCTMLPIICFLSSVSRSQINICFSPDNGTKVYYEYVSRKLHGAAFHASGFSKSSTDSCSREHTNVCQW